MESWAVNPTDTFRVAGSFGTSVAAFFFRCFLGGFLTSADGSSLFHLEAGIVGGMGRVVHLLWKGNVVRSGTPILRRA